MSPKKCTQTLTVLGIQSLSRFFGDNLYVFESIIYNEYYLKAIIIKEQFKVSRVHPSFKD